MASPFETSILTTRASVRATVTPQFTDKDFWSNVLLSPQDNPLPPLEIYTLVTDSGDVLIDDYSNRLVAAT